jgi:hypothetical protein
MNSMFSIDLIKSVGAGDSFNNTLSDLEIAIPERIKMVREYKTGSATGTSFINKRQIVILLR